MSDGPDIAWGTDYQTIERYNRDLPHWRQDGALYFVTFRLADSIPATVVERWLEERSVWLSAHGISPDLSIAARRRRYLAIPEEIRNAFERDEAHRYFVELDRCHGACWLRESKSAAIVGNALGFHDGVRLRCGDFVIMPNHVHWLVLPLPGYNLEALLQSVKRWSAARINRVVNRSGRLWKKESFDHIVRSPDQFERIRDYIEHNPTKARLKQGEYLYHRANWR